MNSYESKRQDRLERCLELADKHEKLSNARHRAREQIQNMIPLGQPILVGHHSEGRHRADIRRIDRHMAKAVEHADKARYYRARAASIQSNRTIFSDDPEAQEKLTEKIERLEKRQVMMREANKLVRKQDHAGLAGMGFSEAQILELLTPDCLGRLGFPDYKLTNNNANIRRLKSRLVEIERHTDDETTERQEKGVRIVDSVEDNRLQLFFRGKPEDSVRELLKSHGFRWSPTNGAWQRHRGCQANYAAQRVIETLKPDANHNPDANPNP